MAVIKTIFKGESLSMLFTFPVAYDMARIEKHEVYIGETAFTGTVSGKTIALKLKSDDTGAMSGQYKVSLWLDDSILGVRKPYLGDIVFSNTNATPHNTSTSNISDIIIPIVISETAVTVGDILYNILKGDKGDAFLYSDFTPEQVEALKVKGDKGDSFEYEDFTPEQITVLQQPATDIASTVSQAEGLRVTAESGRVTAEGLRVTAESNRSGAELLRSGAESDRGGAELLRAGAEDTREGNEDDREQAEALRVQAEIDRQSNTGTAIQNAETATGQANDAAALANSKATLANDAATNANTKAGLADTAATNANTKAGLADTAATTADNARLAIQADLALKENTSNKQNSLATDGTGVKFPTVDAVNAGLAAKQNISLFSTYTHTTNKEVYISAVDVDTNTFTSVAHGLVNTNEVYITFQNNLGNVIAGSVLPGGMTTKIAGSFYVINKTNDTFQLSLTSGGAAIDLTANAGMNLSKWHFEKITDNIMITGIPALTKRIKAILYGRTVQPPVIGAGLISINAVPYNANWYSGTGFSWGINDYCGTIYHYIEVEIDTNSMLKVSATGFRIYHNTISANTNEIINKSSIYSDVNYVNVNISSVIFANIRLANGAKIEIYTL